MTSADTAFDGSIPETYDKMLAPLIFDPYALDLAKRLAATHPRDVLETAAGTGVLTRAMAPLLSSDARLTVTDLNDAMLAQAAGRLSDSRIQWRQADALALPFQDGVFDAVACQFGAMFFPDKILGYREARRVLRPGGHFYFNVWDRISENDFANTVTDALAGIYPQDPPRFMARKPHGYFQVELIRQELKEAGYSSVSVDVVKKRSLARSAMDVAIAYCHGTILRHEIESRDKTGLDRATGLVAKALEKIFGTGAIEGRISALVAVAS